MTTRTLKAETVQRLAKAKDAPPAEVLARLETIKDKEFPNAETLEKWFADNAIPADVKARVLREIPTKGEVASDLFYCLDASTGATIWKQEFPGQKIHLNGCSSTVCVAGERLYATGGNTTVYCLSTKDGSPVWKSPVPRESAGWAGSSSPLVTDGLVILIAGQLTAYKETDGSQVWTQPKLKSVAASPILWTSGGKTHVLCNSDAGLACVEIATGNVLWTAPGGANGTPAVSDDILVQVTDKKDLGIVAYKITPQKAEKLWNITPFEDRGTSAVIYEGHVYAVGGAKDWRALCANLADGKILWQEKSDDFKKSEVSTPIIADGKVIHYAGGDAANLVMFRASPEKYELLAKAKVEPAKVPAFNCTCASIVDGKLFLRLNEHVACFDLGK